MVRFVESVVIRIFAKVAISMNQPTAYIHVDVPSLDGVAQI
jgi:hypothetical protein